MVNLLPAVLVGGPPHAGKSVLFYSLTKTLHERGIAHHAIRACPDGEGNWFQEIYEAIGKNEIRHIYFTEKQWTDAFVNGICSDLERRHLPFLVDMGGRPQDEQRRIFLHCTHSILLSKPEEEENAHLWRRLIAESGLSQLAVLRSELDGTPALVSGSPIIQGTITGLQRGSLASGPVFDALVERIAALFSTYGPGELEQTKLTMAPAQPVNLDPLLHSFDPQAREWKREMLPRLARELPTDQSLAVYGKGPGWLYGTLAAQVGQQPFYQFDPRIGWLSPPTLQVSTQAPPAGITHKPRKHEPDDAMILTVHIANDYLDYLQADNLPFPPIALEGGLIIDGKIPHWLLTALVRLYQNAGAAWIACHQPQLHGAVVVMSRVAAHAIGDLVPVSVSRNDLL